MWSLEKWRSLFVREETYMFYGCFVDEEVCVVYVWAWLVMVCVIPSITWEGVNIMVKKAFFHWSSVCPLWVYSIHLCILDQELFSLLFPIFHFLWFIATKMISESTKKLGIVLLPHVWGRGRDIFFFLWFSLFINIIIIISIFWLDKKGIWG